MGMLMHRHIVDQRLKPKPKKEEHCVPTKPEAEKKRRGRPKKVTNGSNG